jgi:hypothetical protein
MGFRWPRAIIDADFYKDRLNDVVNEGPTISTAIRGLNFVKWWPLYDCGAKNFA